MTLFVSPGSSSKQIKHMLKCLEYECCHLGLVMSFVDFALLIFFQLAHEFIPVFVAAITH